MPQDTNKDIAYIKEWMAKEPHLPQDLGKKITYTDNLQLKLTLSVRFKTSCYLNSMVSSV